MPRSNGERYAVFNVHHERCWICRNPVAFSAMEVDHITPESLEGKQELPGILVQLGQPPDFNLNSYENWMPAHRGCNGRKGDTVVEPTR